MRFRSLGGLTAITILFGVGTTVLALDAETIKEGQTVIFDSDTRVLLVPSNQKDAFPKYVIKDNVQNTIIKPGQRAVLERKTVLNPLTGLKQTVMDFKLLNCSINCTVEMRSFEIFGRQFSVDGPPYQVAIDSFNAWKKEREIRKQTSIPKNSSCQFGKLGVGPRALEGEKPRGSWIDEYINDITCITGVGYNDTYDAVLAGLIKIDEENGAARMATPAQLIEDQRQLRRLQMQQAMARDGLYDSTATK